MRSGVELVFSCIRKEGSEKARFEGRRAHQEIRSKQDQVRSEVENPWKRWRREVDNVDACSKRFLNTNDVTSASVGVTDGSDGGKLSMKVRSFI